MRPPLAIMMMIAMVMASFGTRAAPIDDAKNGWAAFHNGNDAEALRLLTQALGAGQLDPADAAVAYVYRGNVYLHDGQADQAIRDYDEAVRLNPSFAPAYTERANAYRAKTQYDRAIADFNTALNAKADFAPAYRGRGAVYYYQGQYDKAATDLAQALDLQPSYTYAALWLHLARVKRGESDEKEFGKNAQALDRTKWPGPVVSLFLGELKSEELRAAAAQGNSYEQRNHKCEAAFYVGEYELMRRNAGRAAGDFRDATSLCPLDLYEYSGARTELGALGG